MSVVTDADGWVYDEYSMITLEYVKNGCFCLISKKKILKDLENWIVNQTLLKCTIIEKNTNIFPNW